MVWINRNGRRSERKTELPGCSGIPEGKNGHRAGWQICQIRGSRVGGRRNDSTRVTVLRDFESYLTALKERLGIGPTEAQEVIDELECHLVDKASDLESQGVDQDEARALAMEHLGDPEDISRRIRLVYGYAGWTDVLLAVTPHLMMAGLFLTNVCCNYFLIALFLGIIICVSWMNWRNGNPSKWSYSWLGYAMAAPAVSLLIAAHAVGYGAWSLVEHRDLLVFDPKVVLLIGSAPFAMYYVLKVAHEMVKRDWLWVSFACLPLPIFGSWALFVHSYEIYRGVHIEMLGPRDYSQMGIFVAMALMTALYLKLGKRIYKVALLALAAGTLGIVASVSLPAGFQLPNIVMIFLAYVALFTIPVLWKAVINRQQLVQRPVG